CRWGVLEVRLGPLARTALAHRKLQTFRMLVTRIDSRCFSLFSDASVTKGHKFCTCIVSARKTACPPRREKRLHYLNSTERQEEITMADATLSGAEFKQQLREGKPKMGLFL